MIFFFFGGGGIIIVLRVQSYYFGNLGLHANFQTPSTTPSRRIWVRVVLLVLLLLVLVVTTGKQSQLPGLAWDGSLTKMMRTEKYKISYVSSKLLQHKNWYLKSAHYLMSIIPDKSFQLSIISSAANLTCASKFHHFVWEDHHSRNLHWLYCILVLTS